MSRSQDPQKPSFPFRGPFRFMLPKGSNMPSKLVTLLNNFEQTLASRFMQLHPQNNNELSILSLSWMKLALQMLSLTHSDIKSLITDLELPVDKWEEKWIDVYLDNTVKLLDVCTAFSSEISRQSQGQLLLKCLLHSLDRKSSSSSSSCSNSDKVRSSIESWCLLIGSKNSRIDNCCSIIEKLVQSLDSPKIKNSAKGKVLMHAMYGVRVQTVFICSVLIAAFTGSAERLISLQVPETYSWAEAYVGLQASADREIKNSEGVRIRVKELEAVEDNAMALLASTQEAEGGCADDEAIKKSVGELKDKVEGLSDGLDVLAKEVDRFFQIVLSGRDALLCNLRATPDLSEMPPNHKKELMMT